MLGPTNRKEEVVLEEEEKQTALKLAEKEFPDLLAVLLKFNGRLAPYDDGPLFNVNVLSAMTDIEWWTSTFTIIHHEEAVKNVITQFMTAVASSAGIEIIFSTFGLVHSDIRNRLGVDKAAKLTFLMKTLNSHQ